MLISTALYLAIGAAVYTQLEGWSAMQSVYFCMVTMSTVGYGDFSPTHPWTKVITIFMILIGVIAIFSQVGYALSMIFDPTHKRRPPSPRRLLPAQQNRH